MKQHLSQEYYNSIQIFTDGSKNPDTGHTAAAVYIPHFKYTVVLKRELQIMFQYTPQK